MKFFRKTSVAVLLTLLVIALCCVIGYTRAAPNTPQDISDAPAQQAGESGLNYYLSWIDDNAGLFSMDTTDTLARSNLSLHSNYGCLMAIQTINYLNGQDIETYAKNRFEETELGSMDMLLVIETSNQAWYLVYGGTLRPYVEESGVTPTLSSVVSNNLNASFFQGESDQGILRLFDGLETWCAAALPVLDHTSSGFSFFSGDSREQSVSLGDVLQGVLFTLLVNIWWIILVWVVLNVVDRVRFRRYITQYPPGTQTLIPFRPILFWHRQGSSWYRRMLDLVEQSPEDEDDDGDFSGRSATGEGDAFHQDFGDSEGPNQGGPYTGPGPDVGPNAAHFQGNFSQTGNLWGAWRACCRAGWSMFHTFQHQLRRLFGGRRM